MTVRKHRLRADQKGAALALVLLIAALLIAYWFGNPAAG
jgi:hypothetical protein